MSFNRFLPALFCFCLIPLCGRAESFDQWLSDYRNRAIEAGAPKKLVDRSLLSVTYNPRVIQLDQAQPEHQLTLQEYLSKTLTDRRIEEGRDKYNEYASLLRRTEREYGVPGNIMVALWGKETDYGNYTGNFDTLSALATLAYEGRRRHFFEQELLNAIVLQDRIGMYPGEMRGSWAGAIGNCQFMPTNYVKFGIDGDHDGRVNLWASMADVFPSMANMLVANGWQTGESWGQKVDLPSGFDKNLLGRDKQPYDLSFWEHHGVRFTRPVSARSAQAIRLYQPDGPQTPAYALYPNFDVLMRWNRSGYFGVAVGILADQISSNP